MAVADYSSFHLSLANAALFLNQMVNQGGLEYNDCSESLNYFNVCLKQVSQRLGNNFDCISEGLLTTILGFLCHDVGFAALISEDSTDWPYSRMQANGNDGPFICVDSKISFFFAEASRG